MVPVVQICPEGTSFDGALKKTKSKGGTVEGERQQIVPTRLLPNKKNLKSSLETCSCSCSYVLTCCAAFCFVVLRGKLHRVHPGKHSHPAADSSHLALGPYTKACVRSRPILPSLYSQWRGRNFQKTLTV